MTATLSLRPTRPIMLALLALATMASAAAIACSSGTSSTGTTATAPGGVAKPAATTAATQPSGAIGVMVGDTALGKVLTNAKGFTLYTFKKDVPGNGKSAAEAQAAVWPPLSLDAAPSNVAGATGAWAVFTRADGKKQVTYNGSPLYTYAGDQAPGDTTGDKVGGVWFASSPAQARTTAPATSSMQMTQSAAPANAGQPTVAPPAIAAPTTMPAPTVATEPTKAAPTPKPTLPPYMPASGGNGYGY